MLTAGANHVSFTVTDLDRSMVWWTDLFDAEIWLDERDGAGGDRQAVVLELPGTSLLVGLTTHAANSGERFDPTRTGLDNFAFAVASREALDGWAGRFDAAGVEHSGPIDIEPGAILNLKDPDGIALALFWRR